MRCAFWRLEFGAFLVLGCWCLVLPRRITDEMNELSDNTSVLELRGVTKFYGLFKAVDDLTFTLPPGSICGFLGPNGAGKTTTIRMILEIIKPTSGSIKILGSSS